MEEAMQNKITRGHIMRIHVLLYPTRIRVSQIRQVLQRHGDTTCEDLAKHLYYLEDKGYIKSVEPALTSDIDDTMFEITANGIDLAEGTINDDGLYM